MSTPTKRRKQVTAPRKLEVAKVAVKQPEKPEEPLKLLLIGPDGEQTSLDDLDYKYAAAVVALVNRKAHGRIRRLGDALRQYGEKLSTTEPPLADAEELLCNWLHSYVDGGAQSEELSPDKILQDARNFKAQFNASLEHARAMFRRYPTQVIGDLEKSEDAA